MDNYTLLQNLGIELKNIKTSGKCLCPQCSHTRKKKTDPCLSVDVVNGMYNCHNCGWKGYVTTEEEKPSKVYHVPPFNNRTECSQAVIDFFFTRDISQQTVIDFGVTESIRKTGTWINFNYFRSKKLVNIKYRLLKEKDFRLVADAELIFYNLDSLIGSDECIICEGEIDAMSWYEAGYKNVVSVPNGASKNQKMEYMDNCFKYFEDKQRIYLSSDNDEPGIALRDELARRFGKERCFKIDLGDCKDANEYLVNHGKESLSRALKSAVGFPIEGIFTINDLKSGMKDIYLNGMPDGDKTGDQQLDAHIGFMPGELTMVTGVPSHGKSIFLDQISLGLAINSGWTFGICSPESYPLELYFTRLIKRITGRKFHKNNISEMELDKVSEWLCDRYSMIMPKDGFSLDTILSKAKTLVLRKGIKGLIIDPWNRIESQKPSGMNDGEWTVSCLLKIINFAKTNQVHIFLVAHPTKMQKKKDSDNYEVPNLYSISGSAHFYNMTHNGFTVYRNYTENTTEVYIQKVKWEHLGKIGTLYYRYNEDNARFMGPGIEPDKSWIEQDWEQLEIQSAIKPNAEWEKNCPF